MLLHLCFFLAAAPPLPKECTQPPLREVAPIKELANLDGAFSAGLDAVATWCFDSGGVWNGGVLGKPKKPIGPRAEMPEVPPQGDCLKAITSCDSTFETVKNKAPLRELAANALLDFDRPYRGAKYVAKRSGLREAPSEAANCRSKSRTELFAMAQQRMDVARLSSTVLNEYANYKTWLFARGLECRNEIAAGAKDPTKMGVSIDAVVEPTPVLSPKDPELAAALKAPLADKWKYFTKLQTKVEGDRDYTLGFLASRELRGCDCTRVNPAAVLRALEKKGGEAGVALLTSEDPANTRCAVCMFEVFPLWSARAQRQCSELDVISDADLAKLEKSDDVNGLPPRCLDETKAKRAERARLAAEAKALAAAPVGKVPPGRDGGTGLVAIAAVPAPVAPVPGPGTSAATAATGKPGTGNAGAGTAGTGTAGAGTAGAGNAGAGNVGTGNVGAGTVGAGTAGTGTAGTGTAGTGTAGTGTAGTGNVGAGNVGAGNVGAGNVGARNAGAGNAGAGNVGAGNVGTGNVGAGNVGAGNVGAGNVGAGNAGANPNLQTVDGYTYYRPPPPGGTNTPPAGTNPAVAGNPATGTGSATAPTPTPGTNPPVARPPAPGPTPTVAGAPVAAATGPGTPTGPGAAGFTPPTSWAPIPQREDGRIYVRLFMSSACIADVEPGPLQARTGDLLLLPFEARALQVKSPCGGLAEVYFGREARPRVSENFGSNRPLKFEFQRQ